MPPLVSVVLPVYNSEKYLLEAVESILKQTFGDFELIIIDDGSTDDSAKILDSINDTRIIRLRNEKNSGLVVSLNHGISVASGKYIARMDADDISMPERLVKQVNFLEAHPDVCVLGTGIYTHIEGGSVKDGIVRFPTHDKCIRWMLCFRSAIAHVTAVIRREFLMGDGSYHQQCLYAEDYDLWVRLMPRALFANLSEPLVLVRYYAGSSSYQNRITQRKLTRAIQQRARAFYLGDDYFAGLRMEEFLENPECTARMILDLYHCFITQNRLSVDESVFVRQDTARQVFGLARDVQGAEMWRLLFQSVLLDPGLLLRFLQAAGGLVKAKIK